MRLFFAVWPAPRQRHSLVQLAHKLANLSRARVNGADALHLTLAFLGEVDEAQLPPLFALGQALVEQQAAASLLLTHTGSWDNGIVWAAPEQTPLELVELVAQLNAGLQTLGLPVDKRRYKAHITLARRAHRPLAKHPLRQPIELAVDHLALVASELSSAGSRYTTLRRWSLAVPASTDDDVPAA